MLLQCIDFLQSKPECFERSLLEGHFTGSAWITDPEREHVLLMLHRKLDLWLQPGGHCDGDPDVKNVALTEANEETGLSDFKFGRDDIFDVDVHRIPTSSKVPEHLHYDIRFWMIADKNQPLIITHESKDLKWIPIKEVEKYSPFRSITRMVDKTLAL